MPVQPKLQRGMECDAFVMLLFAGLIAFDTPCSLFLNSSNMSEAGAGSAKHDVPSPCGRGDDECHRFSTNFHEPLRFIYLRFRGIHDSHYIGINRLRFFSGETDHPFKVLMADGSKEAAAAAESVVAAGWWAVVGKEHSLLLQLEDPACVSHIGLWCANVGATPLEIEISDARPHFPDLCFAEEPNDVDLQIEQKDPVVHKVDAGCGKSEDECHFFDIKDSANTYAIKNLLLKFRGIHNSHYIGVNRLRIFHEETEIKYQIVAADSSNSENVTKTGGWWATTGQEHFLALEFEKATPITSIGLWCANAGATPKELHVVSDMAWVEDLTSLLESLANDTSRSLGKNALDMIERNSGFLVGLAQGNERLRWALMVQVLAGEAPKFPIKQSDALGRLQARLFCETELQGGSLSQKSKGITGLGWQAFPTGKMPSLEETSVEVESRLLWPSKDHGPEWLGTGLYVPPGGKICVSSGGDIKGWSVRIGAHTDDISGRDVWQRWPRVSSLVPLTGSSQISMYTPFGGNVYLVRCSKASKDLKATFSGNLVQQPAVSIEKGVHVDLKSPGGWVDCEGRKVILTLPVHAVRTAMEAGADIVGALDFYDRLWACYHELSPHTDPRPQRIVPDIEISVGFMHSGYPVMTHFEGVLDTSEAYPIPKVLDVARLKKEGSWGLFHELGHNMQRKSWTFKGTVKVTVNLFTLWGIEKLCDPMEKPHRSYSTEMPMDFVASGSPRAKWDNDPFLALRTYAQVISTFGWKALQATFKRYAEEGEVPRDYAKQVSSFVHTWSIELGRDIRPHWRHWGFYEELKDADPELDKLEPWSFAETNGWPMAETGTTPLTSRLASNYAGRCESGTFHWPCQVCQTLPDHHAACQTTVFDGTWEEGLVPPAFFRAENRCDSLWNASNCNIATTCSDQPLLMCSDLFLLFNAGKSSKNRYGTTEDWCKVRKSPSVERLKLFQPGALRLRNGQRPLAALLQIAARQKKTQKKILE